MGTSSGLVECAGGGNQCAAEARWYTEANGVTCRDVRAVALDRAGNLWVGTAGAGVLRIARSGMVTYTAADGVDFASGMLPALFHDRSGATHVAFQTKFNVRHRERFVQVKPAMPNGITYLGWGWHQLVLQDHKGDWWISTGQGLVRYPNVPVEALGHTPPRAVYTRRDGLATDDIFRIFEDSLGGIWAGSIGTAGVNGLTRWDRATNAFHSYPAHETSAASAFAEDRTGAVWIGYYDGVLARYRDGSPTLFSADDGLAGGCIQALHVDHAGRLWIASTRGLTRADAPNEPHPRFQHFGTEHGLSSSRILCLDEDRWGRLYVATGRGIDRLNATGQIVPGRVHHYTEADGLAHGELRDILFDADGVLWCAASQGISRLTPEPESAAVPPPVLIRQLRVRGVPFPLSDLGETSVPA